MVALRSPFWPDAPNLLTPREQDLLQILLESEGWLVAMERIHARLFGMCSEARGDSAVTDLIWRLRGKTRNRGVVITTVRGRGYMAQRDDGVMFPWEDAA
ncbi:helix-turn-helix domain-containing protein [Rhodovulum sp. BSW8]|uniref:helix-turn-helix domain-containing protein n=1 Tax=Rhodovulum sp. BSW8 TaxID=2259645 RepID=UPI00352A0070